MNRKSNPNELKNHSMIAGSMPVGAEIVTLPRLMRLVIVFSAAVFSLAACDLSDPLVADFNGNSVSVVTSSFNTVEHQRQSTTKEAQRICQKVGKRAEYASTRYNPNTYQSTNLFLCL